MHVRPLESTAIVPARPCLLLKRAISWATSELGYSALRPKQELAVRNFLRGSEVFVSLSKRYIAARVYAIVFFLFFWFFFSFTNMILKLAHIFVGSGIINPRRACAGGLR